MENSILAALPRSELARLEPFLERVHLAIEETLIEPDQPIAFVYFPINCVASIQAIRIGMTEAGLIGYEGCVGVPVWLRQQTTPIRTFIQAAGDAWRMPAGVFRKKVALTSSPMNGLMANYTHSLLVMTSYTAVCNEAHPLEARLCRWLKMMHNRVRENEFVMRQEFLSYMLGVSRPTISIAAARLQRRGWIRYHRARMHILNPEEIERCACACLGLIESTFQRGLAMGAGDTGRNYSSD
jgi:hypothetical protein